MNSSIVPSFFARLEMRLATRLPYLLRSSHQIQSTITSAVHNRAWHLSSTKNSPSIHLQWMLLLHEPAARGTLRSPPSPRPFLSTSTLPGFLSIHPSCPYPFPSQLQPSNQPPIISCTVWYCNPSSGSSIMSDRSCDNFKDKTPQDYALLCHAMLRSGLVDSNPTAQCK